MGSKHFQFCKYTNAFVEKQVVKAKLRYSKPLLTKAGKLHNRGLNGNIIELKR